MPPIPMLLMYLSVFGFGLRLGVMIGRKYEDLPEPLPEFLSVVSALCLVLGSFF